MNDSGNCLVAKLHQALSSNPHLLGRKLEFETTSGVVVLRGTVNSFYQKQMAQEAVRRVDGVEMIDNRLHVAWN